MLDIRTLVVVGAGLCLMAAAALLAVGRISDDRGPRYWSAAMAAIGIGFALMMLRGILPGWLSVVVSNTMTVAGGVLIWMGARAFATQMPVHPGPALAAVAAFVPAFSLLYLYGDLNWRTTFVSSVLSIPMFGAGVELMRRGGQRLVSRNLLAALLFGHGIAILVRVILTPLHQSQTFFASGLLSELFMLVSILLLPSTAIIFAALIAEKAAHALRSGAIFHPRDGHFNATGLAMMVDQELWRGRRDGTSMTVLVADFDGPAGPSSARPRALAEAEEAFRAICRQTLREQDVLGRLDGGPYAVMLPNTHLEDALRIAQRLRSSFANRGALQAGGAIRTLSLGVASAVGGIASGDGIIAAAREAQASASSSGGDRVERAATPTPPVLGNPLPA